MHGTVLLRIYPCVGDANNVAMGDKVKPKLLGNAWEEIFTEEEVRYVHGIR